MVDVERQRMSFSLQIVPLLCQPGVAAVSTSRPRSLLIIVNPVSGAGRAPALAHTVLLPVLRAAGVACTVRATRRRNHTLALLRALSPAQLAAYDGARVCICVCGGGGSGDRGNGLGCWNPCRIPKNAHRLLRPAPCPP